VPRAPLPPELQSFLAAPNPAVVATVRPDGSPVSTATWYEWQDGSFLLSMDAGGPRLRNLRHDPRLALTVLGESFYDHVSLLGHVVEIREDVDLADIDRLSLRYLDEPYDDREYAGASVVARVDRWHTWGKPGR
jgi:PPOX class probable F420-dependent enzyme